MSTVEELAKRVSVLEDDVRCMRGEIDTCNAQLRNVLDRLKRGERTSAELQATQLETLSLLKLVAERLSIPLVPA